MAMTRIKICGITNLEDALCAVGAGADALGFVFYEGSPRYISPEKVRDITAALPPFVTTVGLFVNAGSDAVKQIMQAAGLGVVQLHGDETPADCVLAPYPVMKAVRVKDVGSLADIESFQVSALLLDAWSDQHYGGTGQSFDWQLAKKLTGSRPLVLAGGLNPENVARAIKTVNPYAVDVSSGVEKSPGHKDHDKVYKFIQQVREA